MERSCYFIVKSLQLLQLLGALMTNKYWIHFCNGFLGFSILCNLDKGLAVLIIFKVQNWPRKIFLYANQALSC